MFISPFKKEPVIHSSETADVKGTWFILRCMTKADVVVHTLE